jgi:hypothetical protein
MTSTTITQPATAGTPHPTRPVRAIAFGKLFGLVVAIGTVVALVIAAGIGLAALVLTNASS